MFYVFLYCLNASYISDHLILLDFVIQTESFLIYRLCIDTLYSRQWQSSKGRHKSDSNLQLSLPYHKMLCHFWGNAAPRSETSLAPRVRRFDTQPPIFPSSHKHLSTFSKESIPFNSWNSVSHSLEIRDCLYNVFTVYFLCISIFCTY
jgi:hypothetical protein